MVGAGLAEMSSDLGTLALGRRPMRPRVVPHVTTYVWQKARDQVKETAWFGVQDSIEGYQNQLG